MNNCDLLIIGTGYFVEVMINDIAAVAKRPLRVVIAGRNVPRMEWLVTSANARAALFDAAATFEFDVFDLGSVRTIAEGLDRWKPGVVVQSASLQSPWKVDGRDTAWASLVNDTGFGFTLALQSMLPSRTATALNQLGSEAAFVNTCYPDVVNQVLRAQGLPITCGVGNIAIFSSIAKSVFARPDARDVKVLAHHNHLVDWRKPGAMRTGPPIRVWVDDVEQVGIQDRFSNVQLPFRDLNVISGASAVPVLLALAGSGDCDAHVPGPAGLPGGYPVRVGTRSVQLNLPRHLSESEAVAWNLGFESVDGASVSADGSVSYSERARLAIKKYDPQIADGFRVSELDNAYSKLAALRERLGG